MLLTFPSFNNNSGFTTVPSAYEFKSVKLTIAYSVLKKFVNPLLGRRLNRGVCPPSNPKRTPPPLREFCPF